MDGEQQEERERERFDKQPRVLDRLAYTVVKSVERYFASSVPRALVNR